MELTLYMCRMKNRKKSFGYIARKLNVESDMVTNLDALYDILTEPRGEMKITIRGGKQAQSDDGFPSQLIETFIDASEENPALTVILD